MMKKEFRILCFFTIISFSFKLKYKHLNESFNLNWLRLHLYLLLSNIEIILKNGSSGNPKLQEFLFYSLLVVKSHLCNPFQPFVIGQKIKK